MTGADLAALSSGSCEVCEFSEDPERIRRCITANLPSFPNHPADPSGSRCYIPPEGENEPPFEKHQAEEPSGLESQRNGPDVSDDHSYDCSQLDSQAQAEKLGSEQQ